MTNGPGGPDSKEVIKCKCHGEPMLWSKHPRYTAGGFWRCRVNVLALERERYAKMSGIRYNRKLLMNRKYKARVRRRARHEAVV